MDLEKERLLSLIEFTRQSARLRDKPTANVKSHGLFARFEHEIQALPGIRLNGSDPDGDIWLSVERLSETRPPAIANPALNPWVQMTNGPEEVPVLRESIDAVELAALDQRSVVEAAFSIYLDTKWQPWAREEKRRRTTISLYAQLFTLHQQLAGGLIETQIELIWGVGLGIWSYQGTAVSYPLIGRLVELSLNPATSDVEIRPRDLEARVEVEWYASVENPGVAGFESLAKKFLAQATAAVSPFDRGTFEPLLRSAATHLDVNGIYWPDQVPAEDRTIPKSEGKLKVTDTWVLMARPRTNSVLLQDLERFKARVEEADAYPAAVAAVVTDPGTENPIVELPGFRGVSGSDRTEGTDRSKKPRDLYFPKPYNDEQVRIIQRLEVSNGVVVQGPPGTGKTHTIANVICHYLAEGKRVLVTSMKDAALAVLRDQLPEEIRPLAISLLTTEREGMESFEHAINKIASEVQGLDRHRSAKDIQQLEAQVDGLHARIAGIDSRIAYWAKCNLDKITLETEQIDPQDAARQVVANIGQFEWIPDALGVAPEFAPLFSDADVIRLRDARRALGPDIDYLDASLPQLLEFPDSSALLEGHRDISQFEILKQAVQRGDVPTLADSTHETLIRAREVLSLLERFQSLEDEVSGFGREWTTTMRQRLRSRDDDGLLPVLEALGEELCQVDDIRKSFLVRPVKLPGGIEHDSELIEAIRNLAQGLRPFGLAGLFGKSTQKELLGSIRVLGSPPAASDAWGHVADYIKVLRRQREHALRWNALARELSLEGVSEEGDGPGPHEHYLLYVKVKELVGAESELCAASLLVFPAWTDVKELRHNAQRRLALEVALKHHLAQNRLANAWDHKDRLQKVLEGKTGRVVEDIRRFISETLGNPTIDDAQMQSRWSALMTELSRVLGMGTHLETVRDVSGKIEASGAPKYAKHLQQSVEGCADQLLPDNWRAAWQLRRLATYLESIDARAELKKLGDSRNQLHGDLGRAYTEIVGKRTWLKLANNASPAIRAALQAYLAAIKKASGTGRRAVRYRQDARSAAEQANPAVPCWIMPHYRVSESLPAELGCFDLVVIDEASQSDLTALPALLRAKKVLVVGDHKQVSPSAVGLEEEKIRSLMIRFLANQVSVYYPLMTPERSIYDLFKVVFANSGVMLKEHFRCVSPIIEYSKREFYNHELIPLRLPKASERLDPPLIDIFVEDGYRDGDVNRPEARVIVKEIKAIVADPKLRGRSIGVVCLLEHKQAGLVWNLLTDELGVEAMQRHEIACGDARTFQGKERDIMFLSMVTAPNNVGAPLSRDEFAQRFNVAASRARDRMYLVRSVEPEQLSQKDKYRRSLIQHFSTPFVQDEQRVQDLRAFCESDFEREMYDELTQRGYRVTPQVRFGKQYRIDMVVEGHNDARLAVECDGDRHHGPEQWEADMIREAVLTRAGWAFWRCFASAFVRRRTEVMADLIKTLADHGIDPIGGEGAPKSVHTEHRRVSSLDSPIASTEPVEPPEEIVDVEEQRSAEDPVNPSSDNVEPVQRTTPPAVAEPIQPTLFSVFSVNARHGGLPVTPYIEYSGPATTDPRVANVQAIVDGLVRIVEVEGPIIAKRAYDVYLRSCGIQRLGPEIKSTMNKALYRAVRGNRLLSENEVGADGIIFSVVRAHGSRSIKLRTRGARSFEEIPASELQLVAKCLVERETLEPGSSEHLRAVLEFFDLKRLTTQVGASLIEVLNKRLPHVDEFLTEIRKSS